MKYAIDESHTFLNHTSNEASRIGMKGTGFWPGRWQIARKYALSSAAISCSVASGYVSRNFSMNGRGSLSSWNDWRIDVLTPPSVPATRSSTRRSQSPVRLRSDVSTQRLWCATNMRRTRRRIVSSYVMSPRSSTTRPSFFAPNHGFWKSAFNLPMTSARCSASHLTRFSFGRLKTVSSNSFQSLTPRVAILWIGSPSSERTVRMPPVSRAYVPSHLESPTPGAATMRSLTDELVCASFATMTRLANRKPSYGMRCEP
jgi:hypothetical protein